MWQAAKVAVVIPAYNEERLLGRTLAGIPPFVDGVYVVDDASTDRTRESVERVGDPRVHYRRHETNRGVGAAIVTGYRMALADRHDVLAVMAGDNQMHPDDLLPLIQTVVLDGADYVKGNRFVHEEAHHMPFVRRVGGAFLSALTRMATGLNVSDTQCGFTAISADAARLVPLDELWPRFGYPNDLLGLLAARGLRVAEIAVRPVYAGESSGIRPWHAATISGLIIRRWWRTRRLSEATPAAARLRAGH